MTPLQVLTYPGIGDFSWCYSKLVSLGRPLEIIYRLPKKAQRQNAPVHHRLTPLLELLPLVTSWKHEPLSPKVLDQPPPNLERLKEIPRTHFALNVHLEHGNRIETYAPELETNFHYDLNIPQTAVERAEKLLEGRKDFLLLYPSAKANVENWRGWGPWKWAEFVKLYRAAHGPTPVVVTGAAWDRDLSDRVAAQVGDDVLNLTGQTVLASTLEIVRRSKYFVAFPSGLAIMATVIRKPVFMFYPKHLKPMIPAWADPEDIKSKRYQGDLWIDPPAVLERVNAYLETT